MNPAGAIVIYIVWWWVVFLAVLPRDIQGRWEAPDDGVEGADPGAPVTPNIGAKAWLATKIAVIFWAVTAAIIVSGIFNFTD
ncbi:DUF1467 family protein [Hyphococcus lacteus]|uniref:DUF1467 family protein n=1 Tax=Hyphococcus lacteus TaxID=3143536 RepID=A0ABV3YZP3_9PROT